MVSTHCVEFRRNPQNVSEAGNKISKYGSSVFVDVRVGRPQAVIRPAAGTIHPED